MPTYKTPAIILFKKDLSQDDGLFVILSQNFGKITVKARGVRKIQSKLAGHLLSFSLTDLIIAQGRSYDQVTSANLTNDFSYFKKDAAKLGLAYCAIEIIDQLVKERHPEPEIYQSLLDLFNNLNRNNLSQPLFYLLAVFILKLFFLLGYGPQLTNCQICQKKIIPDNNYFSFSLKGLVCASCQDRTKDKIRVANNVIKILRLTKDWDLAKLLKIRASFNEQKEINFLANKFLKGYLDHELKSEKFLKLFIA